MFLNSYASQIWTQPYFYHNVRKYEVRLAIAMPKRDFSFLHYVRRKYAIQFFLRNDNLHTKMSYNETP